MNSTEMKSTSNRVTGNAPAAFKASHWFTTVLGVLIAIMCLLVVSGNLGPEPEEDRSSGSINASVLSVGEHLSTRSVDSASAILAVF